MATSTEIYACWFDCAPVNQPGSDQQLNPPGTEDVVVVITYFTLIFGELISNWLAMRNAENMALLFTGALGLLSRLAHLPIRALSFSADVVLKLIGSAAPQYPSTSPEVTELLVEQGATETAIRPVEERLISSVFDYSQRHVQDVMTQRTSIISFEVGISPLDALRIAKKLATAFFTRIFRPTMYRHILLPLDGES